MVLPRSISDLCVGPNDGELARADGVPMQRIRRVRRATLLFFVPIERSRRLGEDDRIHAIGALA